MQRRFVDAWVRILFALFVFLGALSAVAVADDAKTAKVESSAISRQGLDELKALLEETRTRAAVVMHRGEVVAEWYWLGAEPDTQFEVWSVSKSYASTCIGLLIDDKKIDSIEDKVSRYVPSWDEGQKAEVTIAHLLDQNSGLEEATNFVFSRDQLQMALEARIITPPGKTSRYNNAACNVLSAVISAAAGKDPESYMREKLWDPLGMSDTSWRRDRAGNVITYAGVQSTARNLARFGLLFYHEGKSNGRPLISADWVHMATNPRTRLSILGADDMAYGLLWWLDLGDVEVPHNYSALGLFGNNLTVIPDLDLIGVRLVGSHADGASLMPRTAEWVERLAGVVAAEKATD